jgi:hypothetical protein
MAKIDLREAFTKKEQVGGVHVNPFENGYQNIWSVVVILGARTNRTSEASS